MKGIQVNDEDYEQRGAGIRVGLSLKGVDSKELDKASWLRRRLVQAHGRAGVSGSRAVPSIVRR